MTDGKKWHPENLMHGQTYKVFIKGFNGTPVYHRGKYKGMYSTRKVLYLCFHCCNHVPAIIEFPIGEIDDVEAVK